MLTPTNFKLDIFSDYLFGIPVWLCFIFGTPLVAWLSCRALGRQAQRGEPNVFKFLGVATEAAKYSFYVHATGFMMTLIIFSGVLGGNIEIYAILFVSGAVLNALLFLFVTAPLGLFCTAVFWILYPAATEADVLVSASPSAP